MHLDYLLEFKKELLEKVFDVVEQDGENEIKFFRSLDDYLEEWWYEEDGYDYLESRDILIDGKPNPKFVDHKFITISRESSDIETIYFTGKGVNYLNRIKWIDDASMLLGKALRIKNSKKQ